MGKETGKLSWGAWIPHFLALLTTPLQHAMEGFVLKCALLHCVDRLNCLFTLGWTPAPWQLQSSPRTDGKRG